MWERLLDLLVGLTFVTLTVDLYVWKEHLSTPGSVIWSSLDGWWLASVLVLEFNAVGVLIYSLLGNWIVRWFTRPQLARFVLIFLAGSKVLVGLLAAYLFFLKTHVDSFDSEVCSVMDSTWLIVGLFTTIVAAASFVLMLVYMMRGSKKWILMSAAVSFVAQLLWALSLHLAYTRHTKRANCLWHDVSGSPTDPPAVGFDGSDYTLLWVTFAPTVFAASAMFLAMGLYVSEPQLIAMGSALEMAPVLGYKVSQ